MKRLIWILLFFFSLARADTVTPIVDHIYDGAGRKFDDIDSACVASVGSWGFPVESYTGHTSNICRGVYTCNYSLNGKTRSSNVYASYKCNSGYYLYYGECQVCISRCTDDKYWNGSQCVAKPECDSEATFNPETGQCICRNGRAQEYIADSNFLESCEGICPKEGTKTGEFRVYLGKFESYDAMLSTAREFMSMHTGCLGGCQVYPNRNERMLGIPVEGSNLEAYYGVFTGVYAGPKAYCDSSDFKPHEPGGSTPPEHKCELPGSHWSESSKTCVCDDGLEPGPEGCTQPDDPPDEGGEGGGESGGGESGGGESGGSGSGEGGSGGTGDNDSNGEEGGTGDDKPCRWWETCFNADGPGGGGSGGGGSGEGGSGEGGSGGGGSGGGGSGGGGSGEGGSGGGGSGEGGSGEGGSGGGGSGGGGSGSGGSGEGGSGGGGSGGGGSGSGGSGSGGSGEGGSDEGNSGESSPADGSYSYPTEKIPSSDVVLEFKPDSFFPDGGSCPSDLSFSLLGHSISTDVISKMCYYIEHYVRPIAQLLGTVLALMICAGAFKG